MNLTQTNENLYGSLRTQLSSNKIIKESAVLIEGLESQQMCSQLIDDDFVKKANVNVNNKKDAQSIDKQVYVD